MGTYTTRGEHTYRPCGGCIGCRLEKARQWAVRCVHEASLHENNSFITLTYNDENLPSDMSVSKREFQLFMKKLRKAISPTLVRFYACGEYGSKLSRPHYHACLFGYDFDDKVIHSINTKGKPKRNISEKHSYKIYRSEQLESIWKKGFSTVGDLTMESAGYVARYCVKKITGEMAPGHYNGKAPEFSLMSRMPGIGAEWLKKYMYDVYPKDYFTINGIKMGTTIYYDSLMKKLNPDMFAKVKERREANKTEETQKRGWEKEKHKRLITKDLERSIHGEDPHPNEKRPGIW